MFALSRGPSERATGDTGVCARLQLMLSPVSLSHPPVRLSADDGAERGHDAADGGADGVRRVLLGVLQALVRARVGAGASLKRSGGEARWEEGSEKAAPVHEKCPLMLPPYRLPNHFPLQHIEHGGVLGRPRGVAEPEGADTAADIRADTECMSTHDCHLASD